MSVPARRYIQLGKRSGIPLRSTIIILSLFLCFFQLSAITWPGAEAFDREENPELEAGLRALREGDVPLAVTLLRSSADDEQGLGAEAWIGLGVAYRRTGRMTSSLEAFAKAEADLAGLLLGWIQYFRAQVLIEAGRVAEADSLLALLAADSHEGPLRAGIMELQLHAAAARGEREQEAAILEDMVEQGEGDRASYAVRLAEIVAEQDAEKASELRSLALVLPGSDEARGRSAEELLRTIDGLDPEKALSVGKALFDLADWSGAERAFRVVLDRAGSGELSAEARYSLGLSLFRQRSYREASALLAEVGKTPGRFRTTAAYYSALATAASSSRKKGAEALIAFTDRFPQSRWAPRTLRMAGERLIESDYRAAKQVLTRLVTDYPTHWGNAEILFQLGSGARDTGDLLEARRWYVQLGQGVFHPHEKARGWYWAARIAEAQGDTAATITYYGRAGDRYPDTYYGARALIEMGRELPEPVLISEIARVRDLAVPEWADQSLTAALVLLRVGLNEEGELQLLYTIRGRPLRKDRLYSIWELCVEGRAYGAAVSVGERLLNGSLWDGDDPRFREIKYPLYYADLIVSETSGWNLDPFLVLALIKQESAFEQDARSYVGARGLMQLMPATADEWARRLRHPPVEDEDLYNPRINLRLGIPYLARLVNQFNGSIEKALAAYNAGPTNVRRWERGLPDERPETFIESIGFSETRTFVRTILNHYYRYRYLWSQRVGG